MTLSDCNSIDTCKNVLLSKFSNYKKPYSFNLIVNRGFNSFKFESRIFINSSSVITWSSASHKPVIQLEKNSANLKSSDLYFQSSDSQNMIGKEIGPGIRFAFEVVALKQIPDITCETSKVFFDTGLDRSVTVFLKNKRRLASFLMKTSVYDGKINILS